MKKKQKKKKNRTRATRQTVPRTEPVTKVLARCELSSLYSGGFARIPEMSLNWMPGLGKSGTLMSAALTRSESGGVTIGGARIAAG
jgi:hypothetical protein